MTARDPVLEAAEELRHHTKTFIEAVERAAWPKKEEGEFYLACKELRERNKAETCARLLAACRKMTEQLEKMG